MTKKKKRIVTLSIVITLVILIVAALYVNLKVFTVKKVLMADEQEVYIMGTFHTEHFERYANYSIEEMINAVKNIEPDVVFIEARENSYTEYGVVDGPIDMCIAYSYCSDNNIPVEMIDYWEITNDLSAQTERLMEAGGQKQYISYKGDLFRGEKEKFVYPSKLCNVWEERVLFYAHTVPQLVRENEALNEETKAKWPEDVEGSFYNWQMKYCNLFEGNNLYMD